MTWPFENDSIVYCILHCGGSDYFDDYYFRFLQFTKNSVG